VLGAWCPVLGVRRPGPGARCPVFGVYSGERPMNNVNTYRVTGLYRRTVGAAPPLKRLVPVASLHDAPAPFGIHLGHLCPDVLFTRLEDQHGVLWWAKQWLHEREPLLELTWQIERFLATLPHDDLILAHELCPEYGLIYPYHPGLFESPAILHQLSWPQCFTGSEYAALRKFAATPVRWPGLPKVPLGQLTDLQATRLVSRIVCLDFEPSPSWALRLAGVTIP